MSRWERVDSNSLDAERPSGFDWRDARTRESRPRRIAPRRVDSNFAKQPCVGARTGNIGATGRALKTQRAKFEQPIYQQRND